MINSDILSDIHSCARGSTHTGSATAISASSHDVTIVDDGDGAAKQSRTGVKRCQTGIITPYIHPGIDSDRGYKCASSPARSQHCAA
jgi:hypothetical protein